MKSHINGKGRPFGPDFISRLLLRPLRRCLVLDSPGRRATHAAAKADEATKSLTTRELT